MRWFAKTSIRRKMILSLSTTTALALIVAAWLFAWRISLIYTGTYRHDLATQATIIGANCTAALSFGLADDASAVLATLAADPSMVGARILDREGRDFACYRAGCAGGNPLSGQVIEVSEPIRLDGVELGKIELYDNMTHLRAFRAQAALTLLLVLVVVLPATALLIKELCTRLTQPLHELAFLAATIAADRDYSRRAPIQCEDEVGHLARAFNAMLGQIDRSTHELTTSERRFRALVEQGVDAFFLHDDHEGRFIDVNQAACDSLGYSREELLALTVADIDGDSVPRLDRERFWQSLRPGEAVTLTSRHKRRDGSFLPVEVRLGVLEIDGRRTIMALVRDISERLAEVEARHAVELQLNQAQKMESIGNLAGGIAHDFNNILSAVIGFTDLALMQTAGQDQVQDNLRQVRKAGDRAAALVKQILTFSRKQPQERSPLQISLVVKEAMKLLRASIPSTIDIQPDIRCQGLALADPTQIHQVVMNLCTNAYHAMMAQGGVLTVSLTELVLEQPMADGGTELPPGHYLQLAIGDTGCGIARENLPRIFEPYFTTKEQGKGTGLGLAVVHGIVRDHQGRIAVYSEPGHGTIFRVYLPMIVSDQAVAEQVISLPPLSQAHERILVVDDEEAIRHITEQFLTGAGYRVETAASGVEAWEVVSQGPEVWQLVISDQTMPGMTGAQLAAKLRELRPELPVILCSGFSDTIDESRAQALGVKAYLQKPVTIEVLLRTVAAALKGTVSQG